jgi:hypothetical protein
MRACELKQSDVSKICVEKCTQLITVDKLTAASEVTNVIYNKKTIKLLKKFSELAAFA